MSSDPSQIQIAQLQEENRRLRVAVEELSILNDIATAITSTQSLEQIVDMMVQKCVKHLRVEQGVVMLLDEKDQDNPFHTMVRKKDSRAGFLPFRLDTQLTGWMLKNRTSLLINDFKSDDRFQYLSGEDFPIRTLLSVPMQLKGKLMGLLTVFNKRDEAGFTGNDQRLLAIIAAQSAQVIENARLYLEEQTLQRMQEDMRLAAEIQGNLLPKDFPAIPGYEITGKSIPAKEVGGDYFDFIPVDDHQIAFCLGDVSGKGMPAALLMANLQATLRGQTLLRVNSKECLTRANKLLFLSTDSKKFATLFYGVLDTMNHQLIFCNAGHDNPFLISDSNELKRLKTGGIVLGFIEEYNYEEETILLNRDDVLVLISDGITEAMNASEEEFGESRLAEVIQTNREKPAEEIIEHILAAVKLHTGETEQMDDMTVVVIKRQ